MGIAARHAMAPGVVDDERIFAALDVYILAGLAFGMGYWVLDQTWPESFAITSGSRLDLARAIHFSFVTVATLGYGDIVPVSEAARGLAVLEAVGGQVYLAVLVARLVSLYSRQADDSTGSRDRLVRGHDARSLGLNLASRQSDARNLCFHLSEVRMRLIAALLLTVTVTAGVAPLATATSTLTETTLEKITRIGVLVVGTRTSSPPFAYINRSNEWVGFSIDLVEQGVLPAVSAKVGKPVKIEKIESTPATRVTLLVSRNADLIAETMTDAPQRRADVGVSLTYFLTGGQFLVKKGSPIKGIGDLAGQRVAVLQRSTYARLIREQVPKATLVEFPDQPDAVGALVRGKVDAYTNDGVQLYGLKYKMPDLNAYEVVGRPYTRESYAMAMRKGDSAFREVVNAGLRTLLESGKYFEIYEKWFGEKGEAPYPLTPQAKQYLLAQLKK